MEESTKIYESNRKLLRIFSIFRAILTMSSTTCQMLKPQPTSEDRSFVNFTKTERWDEMRWGEVRWELSEDKVRPELNTPGPPRPDWLTDSRSGKQFLHHPWPGPGWPCLIWRGPGTWLGHQPRPASPLTLSGVPLSDCQTTDCSLSSLSLSLLHNKTGCLLDALSTNI